MGAASSSVRMSERPQYMFGADGKPLAVDSPDYFPEVYPEEEQLHRRRLAQNSGDEKDPEFDDAARMSAALIDPGYLKVLHAKSTEVLNPRLAILHTDGQFWDANHVPSNMLNPNAAHPYSTAANKHTNVHIVLAADRPFMLKEVTIHPPKATVPTLAMAYNAPAGLGLLWTMLDSIDLRTQQLAPYRVFDNMEQSAFNDWKTNNPSSSDRPAFMWSMNLSTPRTIKTTAVGQFILIKVIRQVAMGNNGGATNLDIGYWEFKGSWADPA